MTASTGRQIVDRLGLDEPPPTTRLTFTSAAAIVPTSPEWLWEGWLLSRALNLLAGRQGSGKTTFVCYVLAALVNGTPLPGVTETGEPIRAAFLSLEEPPDRVVARLYAAGADLERVLVLGDMEDVDDEGRKIRRRWSLPKDIAALGRVISEQSIGLVIVDGLGYAISGDSHNYAVVGSALAALAGEADRTGAAILGLVHPPKGGSDPVTAAIGSTAWTAIPRISMVLGQDPEDDTGSRRVVRVAKSNYRPPENGLRFTIGTDPTYECGFVQGIATSTIRAEDITAGNVTDEDRTERAEARDFLREYLSDGPSSSDDAIRAAEKAGISKRTLFRARKDLGVVSTRRSDPTSGRMTGWELSLPVQNATVPTTVPTTVPLPEGWHSGHSGHTQVKESVSAPGCQDAKAGILAGTLAVDEHEEPIW